MNPVGRAKRLRDGDVRLLRRKLGREGPYRPLGRVATHRSSRLR